MNRGYMNNGIRPGYRGPVGGAIPVLSTGYPQKPESGKALAMAYVPSQKFENLYATTEAIRNGTLFKDLNLPYCTGGGR